MNVHKVVEERVGPSLFNELGGIHMELSRLRELIADQVQRQGVELYDLEYVQERKTHILRVVIDKPEGIDIEDCVAVSNLLDPRLDEWDPFPAEYSLEVTSPGAERKLRNPGEINRAIGQWIHVETASAKYEGELLAFDGAVLTLKIRTKTIQLPVPELTLIRTAVKM